MRNIRANIKDYSEYKYRIKEKLEQFTYTDYVLAKKQLPKALGVNPRTFERYLYTKHTSCYEMPANHLAALARFFTCTMEELLNYEPKQISLRSLNKTLKSDLAKSLGLIK
jgi:hypothetical protein